MLTVSVSIWTWVTFFVDRFNLATNPNKISTGRIGLHEVDLDILSESVASTKSDSAQLPPLDFNTGFEFAIQSLELRDHRISYHLGSVKESAKFSPEHIDLDTLQLNLSEVLISEDSLTFEVNSLKGKSSRSSVIRVSIGNCHRNDRHEGIGSAATNRLRQNWIWNCQLLMTAGTVCWIRLMK